MQAANHAAPTAHRLLKWLGALPVALVVALSLPACSSDARDLQSDTNATDPSCRPATCATMGKNCGIVSDGCGGSLRCGTCSGSGNDCRNNVCERSCSTNAECPSGSACVSGSCTDKCNDSRDCPSGQWCNGGSCTPNSAQACQYDSECRSDERCVNGQCGMAGGNRSCRYDSECPGGERCQSGYCSGTGSRTCRYDTDCGDRETCTNGYCSYHDGGDYCRSDRDCDYGERCSYGVCRRTDGRVRAQCVTNGIKLPLPFGSIEFVYENWLYDSQNPNGVRVDSCACRSTRVLTVDMGDHNRDFTCSSCAKSGSETLCFQ